MGQGRKSQTVTLAVTTVSTWLGPKSVVTKLRPLEIRNEFIPTRAPASNDGKDNHVTYIANYDTTYGTTFSLETYPQNMRLLLSIFFQ